MSIFERLKRSPNTPNPPSTPVIATSQKVSEDVATILEPNMVAPESQETFSLGVADLTRMIDTVAESQAVEAFDQEMRQESEKTGFAKMGGFFKRSFMRMGRDAWINSKKHGLINQIQGDLTSGVCNEQEIRAHYEEVRKALQDDAYLDHEHTQKDVDVPAHIQTLLDAWVNANPTDRNTLLPQLKQALDHEYTITTELGQLEQALVRFESAKLEADLKTLSAKMNVFDIGGYESGYGQRNESAVVRALDWFYKPSSRRFLPDWVKHKVGGFVQNPNFSAIVSALGTRIGLSVFVGGATLGAAGLFIPVAVGATAGGILAAGRARREMRDRTAQIDRRGATGLLTGTPSVDGQSSHELHDTKQYQHPVLDFYTKVALILNGSPSDTERKQALSAGLSYLIKHRLGREKHLNLLSYESDTSVSKQHLLMIQALNVAFPGLVARFNSQELFQPQSQDEWSIEAQRLFPIIDTFSDDVIGKRISKEKKYALKQGGIYAGVAGTLGGTVGYALHELGIFGTEGGNDCIQQPGASTIETHYPNNLEAFSNVKRDFWFDNSTPNPDFDYTELMIHQDGQNWNVHKMLGENPFTQGTHLGNISGTDFSTEKLQAVLTPKNGGPSFLIPIDASGNLVIPPELQADFDARNFAFLEVGKVSISESTIHLTPIATVTGDGTMILEPLTQVIPGVPVEVCTPTEEVPWYGVPFGGNKYHHLQKPQDRSDDDDLTLDLEDLPPHAVVTPFPTEPLAVKGAGTGTTPEEQEDVEDGSDTSSDFPAWENVFKESDKPQDGDQDLSEIAPLSEEPVVVSSQEDEDQNRWINEYLDYQDQPTPDSQLGSDSLQPRTEMILDEYGNEVTPVTALGKATKAVTQTQNKLDKVNKTLKDRRYKNKEKQKKQLENKSKDLQRNLSKQKREYNEQLQKLYEKETPEQQALYQESLRGLVDKGILATDNDGKILTYHVSNRMIVGVKAPNGHIVPFYRSSEGTSRKTKGKWYPVFGISPSGWFVKGGLPQLENTYSSQVLQSLSTAVNGACAWDHEWDLDYPSTKPFHPFSVFGEANSVEWIEKESQSQVSLQTWDGQGLFPNYWISEWIARLHAPKNMTLAVDSYGLYPQFLALIEGQEPLNNTELQGTQRQKACEFMFQKLLLSHDGIYHQPMLKKIVSEKIPVHIGDFPTSGQNGLCLNLTDQERGTDDFWSLSKHLNQAMSEYSLLQFRAKSQDHEERFHQLEQRFPDPSLAFGILSKGYTSQRAYNSSQGILRSAGLSPDLIKDCIDLYQDVSTETFSSYETGIFF